MFLSDDKKQLSRSNVNELQTWIEERYHAKISCNYYVQLSITGFFKNFRWDLIVKSNGKELSQIFGWCSYCANTQNVTTSIKLSLSTEDKSWNLEGTCNLDLHSYLTLTNYHLLIIILFYFLASISHYHLWWLLTRDFNQVTVQIKNGVVIVAPHIKKKKTSLIV